MTRIAIVTDSTSDLPRKTAAEWGVHVVPALVVIDGEAQADGERLSREAFYEQLPHMVSPPTTAAPAGGTFEQLYAGLFESGVTEVVSIHAASTLSGIYNAAWVGAKPYGGRVHVIDSGQITLGLGFQVLEAADAARAGAQSGEIIARVDGVRARIKVVAMVDTLEYLRRSGRVSAIRAQLGSMLKMRVFIELTEGRVDRIGQTRTRTKAIAQLGDMLEAEGDLARLAVLHTNIPAEAERFAAPYASSVVGGAMVVNVTTVIGTHVGPNALGFAVVRSK